MATNLYLIRHGETEWSRDDRFTGVSDIPLTDIGREQANTLSLRLAQSIDSIGGIYSSPKIRSFETAQIIASPRQLSVETMPELTELDYGEWEGLARHTIISEYAHEYRMWSNDPIEASPPSGETGISLLQRAVPTIEQLVEKHEGENIVVVAHNSVNRLLICALLGIPTKSYRVAIKQEPACLNLLRFNPGNSVTLVKLNDIVHYAKNNGINDHPISSK